MSDSLRFHGLQHTRLLCPSLSPRVCSNSCPLGWWCYLTISSAVAPLLLLLSIFPTIRVFSSELPLCIRWPNEWSVSVSPSNEYSELISFRTDSTPCSSRDSQVFSSTVFRKHQFSGAQPSLWSNSHIHTWLLEKPQLWLDRPLLAK